MTEMTVKKTDKLKEIVDVDVSVYFAGGNQTLMKAWLGNNYNYYPQNGDNLGEKCILLLLIVSKIISLMWF